MSLTSFALTVGKIVVGVVVVLSILQVYDWYLLHRLHARARKHGCGEAQNWPRIPIGLPFLARFFRAARVGRVNQWVFGNMTLLNYRTTSLSVLCQQQYVTVDAENIKAILSTQFKEFGLGKRHDKFQSLLGHGIFAVDGENWQMSRAMLRPQFTRDQVSQLETLRVHSTSLIRNFKKAGAKGLDVQEQCFKYTMDTATEFLFGRSVDTLNNDDAETNETKFASAFNYVQKAIFVAIILDKYGFIAMGLKYRHEKRIVHKFIDGLVNDALQRADSTEKVVLPGHENYSYIFLDELIKQTRDPQVLRDQTLNILLAGRDTTAGTLTWCLYYLAKDRRVFNKLREAVLSSFPHGAPITFETLKQCVYLRYFINEILRLYPQVPANFRDALVDTTLPRGGGPNFDQPVFVPKGMSVRYFPYSMHRVEKYWGSDALDFNPDRWEDKRNTGWEYLPFNGGPRICIGQQFALTEASYTVVRILQAFSSISFVNPNDIEQFPTENVGFTLSSNRPVVLHFTSDPDFVA